MDVFFITGTDTGIGKTYVTCAHAAEPRRYTMSMKIMRSGLPQLIDTDYASRTASWSTDVDASLVLGINNQT